MMTTSTASPFPAQDDTRPTMAPVQVRSTGEFFHGLSFYTISDRDGNWTTMAAINSWCHGALARKSVAKRLERLAKSSQLPDLSHRLVASDGPAFAALRLAGAIEPGALLQGTVLVKEEAVKLMFPSGPPRVDCASSSPPPRLVAFACTRAPELPLVTAAATPVDPSDAPVPATAAAITMSTSTSNHLDSQQPVALAAHARVDEVDVGADHTHTDSESTATTCSTRLWPLVEAAMAEVAGDHHAHKGSHTVQVEGDGDAEDDVWGCSSGKRSAGKDMPPLMPVTLPGFTRDSPTPTCRAKRRRTGLGSVDDVLLAIKFPREQVSASQLTRLELVHRVVNQVTEKHKQLNVTKAAFSLLLTGSTGKRSGSFNTMCRNADLERLELFTEQTVSKPVAGGGEFQFQQIAVASSEEWRRVAARYT